ncbi:UbiD family decarboxylase [candidate division WS5 bacterium]|uniref:UbiD family decarboxylase n=1 Tax=candidate division WS5 bacterium TaxID=2093353 RepID=A0A419DAL2_9BACT|nr:MAG: UbiD family decarboxylase [candidate division WS5 bacterium]
MSVPKDLRSFLHTVEEAGPRFFRRVEKPVNPNFDVSVIQQKLTKTGQFPVLHFTKTIGSPLSIVSNLFGNYENLGLALDLKPKQMAEVGKGCILEEYIKRKADVGIYRDVNPSRSPVRELVIRGDQVDLALLPIGRHAELNGGKYITIGVTVLVDPDTGHINAGIYRHMILGKDSITCNITPNHHGSRIIKRYQELGKSIPVAIIIGHHPALFMGAAYSGPSIAGEFEFISTLLNEPLDVVKGITVDVPIFARSEIAIEGILNPNELVKDGPFSEATGYYDDGNICPTIKVMAITMRHDAIYHDLCPMNHEHLQVNKLGRESLIYEGVKKIMPCLRSVHQGPESAVSSGVCFAAINKISNDDGYKVGMAIIDQMRSPKLVVIVDDDVDIFDQSEVLWAVCTRMGQKDKAVSIHTSKNSPIVLIDATKPLGELFPKRSGLPQNNWDAIRLEDYL